MTPEEAELLIDWKATYGERHPRRDPNAMPYTDAMVALGLLLRREIAMAKLIRQLPPGNASGLARRLSAKPKGRKGAAE